MWAVLSFLTKYNKYCQIRIRSSFLKQLKDFDFVSHSPASSAALLLRVLHQVFAILSTRNEPSQFTSPPGVKILPTIKRPPAIGIAIWARNTSAIFAVHPLRKRECRLKRLWPSSNLIPWPSLATPGRTAEPGSNNYHLHSAVSLKALEIYSSIDKFLDRVDDRIIRYHSWVWKRQTW